MTFNSLDYAIFLPVVMAMYWNVGARNQLRLLLSASYLFYGWWDVRFLGLIAFSTVVDFSIGRMLGAAGNDRRRWWLVVASVTVNLGILGAFKYFDFFVDSAIDALGALGWDTSAPTLDVLLPVGISFYTFQTISYSVDVYRRQMAPTKDLLTFSVFVAFFPQLVAGPIERARHLLPQFERARPRPVRGALTAAAALILQGLVKKVVIADGLAPYVDDAFGAAGSASAPTLAVGVVCFAFQIYGDFSGYTDIARGSARMLGVDLMVNFRQPYLARSVTEFWRQWHISLSTWLRDYLYIPLGGNRSGRSRTLRNLALTMVLGGLWHGAAWTFVAWGALHGGLLAAERALGWPPPRPPGVPRPSDLPFVLGTFAAVCTGWVLFRSESIAEALRMLGGMLSLRAGSVDLDAVVTLVVFGGAMVLLDIAQRRTGADVPLLRCRSIPLGAAAGASLVSLVVFSGGAPVPFLYFRF